MAENATEQRPIIQLSTQLANQIAAGEVVERPASVVKELLENSLDAGATQIDIDILNGGKQLIRIRDNGRGIAKDQLSLALAPHATSKILDLDDLLSLHSFGFRGEALASISSVSKFRLTSRTVDQEEGWCAVTEGHDMEVRLSPAPATVGTRIDVEELFHNTPDRRRFLRTDKTELAQIETVVRQVALAHPDVTITLKHNQRVLKRYKAAFDLAQVEQRLATICGNEFLNSSVRIAVDHEDLKLSGWLALPDYHRSQTDGQYFFVNDRPVKDKVLNHALREAYHPHIPEGRSSAYVLFLTIPAEEVDVNVHPTKHEVRFHNVRQVHDFIVQALEQSLHKGIAMSETNQPEHEGSPTVQPYKEQISENMSVKYSSYADFISSAYRDNKTQATDVEQESSGTKCIRIGHGSILLTLDEDVVLVKIAKLFEFWQALTETDSQRSRLLFPQLIGSDYQAELKRFADENQLELLALEGQVKLLSAPVIWQAPYLHQVISDYLEFNFGQGDNLNLSWVSEFIDSHRPTKIMQSRPLSDVEEFFGGED